MIKKPLISFDYAIKYLLKDKGDHEIVEGFISALLELQGYKSVKIIALLDTESNKEHQKSKRSLADLIVEDEDKHKYIVEIERNLQEYFIHKACFNTSRLIIDNLSTRADFADITKVFHISILYFPVGHGPVYHGHTIIKDIKHNEKLTVHIKNPKTGITVDATDVFPEYFFISVPLFNDRLEKEIDEWLYVMKHDEVPENFKSSYMPKVNEKMALLKMTPEEQQRYYAHMKATYTYRDEVRVATNQGIEIGREEGMIAIAKKMLIKQRSMEEIMDLTELTQEQIEQLKESS